jgi:V/A-type H+-transporting ATPase subunit I
MAAFFQIAGMVSPNGGISVAGVLVLIAGNVLVIALEGLSAGIQSLRLNYYEFFSKYFNSTGRAYSPISFRSRD